MTIFRSYFDCFLPELRDFNYQLWVKVIVIYKLVLPIMFLIMYMMYREKYDEKNNLIIISNIILLIIGIENGIGVFSWVISETFSLYNILFLILQCIIKFQNAASNTIDKETTNEIHIYILFRNFNEKMYISFSWLNFATMIPAIFMLLLITICTCQIKLFQSLIKRNIRYQEDEIFDEYNGEEGFECSICMEELKQMEKYVELPCNHIFHYQCFGKWRNYKQLCPVCRRKIKNNEINKQFQQSKNSDVEI
ncbi:unnamed protein product [Paramecium pentaurelia]|uniref:RING-type domain-containing protein n=2 Tax=Paramecium pentaurelia TaxID=43138 RepID=A0A8S1UJS0_9CILI|nr:unnamed protein product [Paramecium pentaurelia]